MISQSSLIAYLLVLPLGMVATSETLRAEMAVGGKLVGSVRWTAAESPLIAGQTIEVPIGSTLTIDPGVEIRLAGHSFTVRGTLIARGTAESPIRFTSQNLETPAAQDWGLLSFEGRASGATFDESLNYRSGSILNHVVVEYGHGLVFDGGAPAIENCTIRHHRKKRGGGIYAHGCKPVIRDSVCSYNIAEEEGGGIRAAYSQLVLIGNTIVHNSAAYDGGGISVDYNVARIEGNTISHNFASHAGGLSTGETQVGQTSMTGSSHSSPLIRNNRITNNSAYYAGGGIVVKGTPVIVGNTITGNRIHYTQYATAPSSNARIERKVGAGAGIKVTGTYGGPLSIQRNVIAGNRGAFWGAGMCFDRAAGTVTENRIVGNAAQLAGGAVSILVRSSGKSFVSPGHGADWRFARNDIRGNLGGAFELAMARFGGTQSIEVDDNNLSENQGKVFVNHTPNNVQSRGNWWGTKDPGAIGQLVDDYFDQSQRGQIRFRPVDGTLSIKELPEMSARELAFRAAYPHNVRAGQGFQRIPGTPPSVTVAWQKGNLVNVAGYRVHFARIKPRFDRPNLKDDMRIPARCREGLSPLDVGDVQRAVLSGLALGETYEFFVTAYDAEGLESAISDPYVVKIER